MKFYTILQENWRNVNIETFYVFLACLSVFLVIQFIQWLMYIRSLPPGPWGIPYLGYIPFIKPKLYQQYDELAKKYGPIFSTRQGNQLIVVLSDANIIRKAFNLKEYTDRPHTEFTNILGGYGFINTDGTLWENQRKFLHKIFRKLGMTSGANRSNLEKKLKAEIYMFLWTLKKKKGAPTNISPSLTMSVSNIICGLIMDKRFSNESQFQEFMSFFDKGFELFASLGILNYLPSLRFLPFMRKNLSKFAEHLDRMRNSFERIIAERRANLDRNNLKSIVDFYLDEMQQVEKEDSENQLFEGENFNLHLQQIVADLFSAGMETVKSFVKWSIILMLHYPEAAKAVQEELDRVVERSKMPKLEDLPSLPITEATIQEILRIISHVPLGTTHATTRNMTLHGYTIPAGSQIIPLLYSLHMNPELWDEPKAFRPARFLSSEGKLLPKPTYFMPFGIGKRVCLGQDMARQEIFLFFSSLMHTFDFALPEGASLPSLEGMFGITISPDPYEVCLLQRSPSPMDNFCDDDEFIDEPLRNVGSH
ncbi:cytochrome P450 18a1 [Anoplolepis gracilipes]|uniref:cytochrome P450 18a1 n=1 Tax=Anoplolepis gracilipes TaxID=354296 RepID=UPI003BA05783